MGVPTGSYATAGIAPKVLEITEPSHQRQGDGSPRDGHLLGVNG